MITGFIYKITNVTNGKCYIGQSRQKHDKRKREHFHDAFNDRKPSYNCLFYRAIRKYGAEVWTYEVLQDGIPVDELDDYEVAFVKQYASFGDRGYNSDSGGKLGKQYAASVKRAISTTERNRPSPMKGRRHSDEARRKISEAGMGRTPSKESIQKRLASRTYKRGKDHPNYGKHLSEETKSKISAAHKNMSPEARQHVRLAAQNRCLDNVVRGDDHPNAVLTWDKVNNARNRFASGECSAAALASECGVSVATMCKVLANTLWKDPSWGAVINTIREERPPTAKLTWAIVREIRAKFATGLYSKTKLAEEYGVDRTNIGCIILNKTWVEEPVLTKPETT